jgi:ribosome-associated toxin RatA of RatAB toxin-antitoxin module
MKDLHGTASAVVPATLERCVGLLAAIDAYPDWYPEGVREADVLERDPRGQPTKARTVLHVDVAGFDRDFNLTMSVEVDPKGRVALKKIKADSSDPPFDVTWRISEEDGTLIELDLDTALPVPRLVPLGGVGDSIAESFVSAASEALGAKDT